MSRFSVVLAAVWSVSGLQAATYTLTAPNYSSTIPFATPCAVGACANFTNAMKVTGSFTTASPLAANLSAQNVAAQVTSYSFNDGLDTFSSADTNSRLYQFDVTTNASGNLTVWQIYLEVWATGGSSHTTSDRFNLLILTSGFNQAYRNLQCNSIQTRIVADTCTNALSDPPSSSAGSSGGSFALLVAPTVTAVSPSSGLAAGGTAVTITGTNFIAGATVSFGGTPATGVTVANATTITATSPSGSGTVNVTVTTVGGTSATGAASQFAYIGAPTITGLSPATSPPAGGVTVTITGTNLNGVLAVSFGGTPAASFTPVDATTITAVTPALAAAAVDVTVTTPGGTSAIGPATRFAFAVPAIPALSPVSGAALGLMLAFAAYFAMRRRQAA